MELKREHPRLTSAPEMEDRFLMYVFKVKPCTLDDCECPDKCPFRHPGEEGRRDPRRFCYRWFPCSSYFGGSCPQGDACQYAHGLLETMFHPAASPYGLGVSFFKWIMGNYAMVASPGAASQLVRDLHKIAKIIYEYKHDDIPLNLSYIEADNQMAIDHAARYVISKLMNDLPKTTAGSTNGPKFVRITSGSCKPEFAGTSVEARMVLFTDDVRMPRWGCWGSALTDPNHGMLVEPDLKLDSGASFHVFSEETPLHGYQSFPRPGYIHVADGYPLPVVGAGDMISERFIIPNIHRVIGLKENLISVSQLARDHGLFAGFHGKICEILKRDGEKVGGGFMQANGMYKLRFLEVPEADGAYEDAA